MVGGGSDAFIGAVHRRAALMENEIELVCGCFSVNPEISISSGRSYYVPDNRIYTTWEEMFEKEAALPAEERMDFVTIVTPNRFHFGPAMRALELGFNVVIDKPMTLSLEEALKLRDKVRETGLTLALTHVYSGYPAVKEAKKRIARGDIGRVRRVFVEYSQGWLTQRIELKGGNNAVWRNDPKQAGKGGCVGDIGTHAWHLAEYVTGGRVTELCAELQHVAEGRPVDDDALDVVGIHGVGGTWGAFATGLFASAGINGVNGLFYGNPWQLVVQIISIVATWGFVYLVSRILLKLTDALVGLRVDPASETRGLDLSLHNERGYTL